MREFISMQEKIQMFSDIQKKSSMRSNDNANDKSKAKLAIRFEDV
jgi:hypothetical protein